jgi:hypothetical protein
LPGTSSRSCASIDDSRSILPLPADANDAMAAWPASGPGRLEEPEEVELAASWRPETRSSGVVGAEGDWGRVCGCGPDCGGSTIGDAYL